MPSLTLFCTWTSPCRNVKQATATDKPQDVLGTEQARGCGLFARQVCVGLGQVTMPRGKGGLHAYMRLRVICGHVEDGDVGRIHAGTHGCLGKVQHDIYGRLGVNTSVTRECVLFSF